MPFEKNNYLIPAFKLPEDYDEPNYSDLKHDYQHPNVNSFEYRQTVSTYNPPTTFPRFFTALDINRDGLFMMAANNFNTNIFDSVIAGTYDFEDFAACRFDAIKLKEIQQSNVTVLKFMKLSGLLAASTGVELHLFTPNNEGNQLVKSNRYWAKSEISCFEELTGTDQIVVGTRSGHMDIINQEDYMTLGSRHHQVHMEEITGISMHPAKEKCWVTVSSDHCCLLWDRSQALRASFLVKDHRDRLTDVKWISANSIWASDSSGNVFLVDPRQPKAAVSKQKVAPRTISALKFAKDGKTLGVVNDSPELKIFQIDAAGQLKAVHEHSARPWIIYSMAWDPKDENVYYVVGDGQQAQKVSMKEATK